MDISSYKAQVIESLKFANSMDCADMPNYRTMLVVYEKLKSSGMDEGLASRVVATTKFDVAVHIFNDVIFMEEVTSQFTKYIMNLEKFSKENFGPWYGDRLIDLLDGVALTLTHEENQS